MNMRRGFTVVELVVTITVMAILLTLGVVNMRSSQANSRDSERKSDVETIAMHLETYYTSETDGQAPTFEYPSIALTSNGSSYMTQVLRDININSLTAPGVSDPNLTFIPATNSIQDITSVSPQPTIDQYVYQPIRRDGTLCDPSNSNIVVDALIVGGGGGGGAGWQGGGGGAGGYIYEQNIPVSINDYQIRVGEGGTGGNTINNYVASNGESSSFNNRVAIGGGKGAGEPMGSSYGSSVGGSGGGGSHPIIASAAGTSGQGYAGGTGYTGNPYVGAGGGGAGGAGANATISIAGSGGLGINNSISGFSIGYAGGGGGSFRGGTSGSASFGGGGGGAIGYDGTNNTGGGGGAGQASAGLGIGGKGGSGIVIIRYIVGSIFATGGEITTYGNYKVHTFRSDGIFKVTGPRDCSKFNLYYRTEVDNTVHMITSKNQ